jgi:hypothetical protein
MGFKLYSLASIIVTISIVLVAANLSLCNPLGADDNGVVNLLESQQNSNIDVQLDKEVK